MAMREGQAETEAGFWDQKTPLTSSSACARVDSARSKIGLA